MLFGLSEVAEDGAEIWSNLAASFTPLTAYSFMLFNLLCAPCFAAMGAIKREMNSASWTWAAIGYLCGYAYLIAFIVYQLGTLFTTGQFGVGTVFAIAALCWLTYLLLRKNKYGEYGEYLHERKVSVNV